MKAFSDFGITVPDILLPKQVDVSSWSCIACDQYTQDRAYWQNVEKIAAGKSSAYNLILPEAYLDDGDKAARIAAIKSTMKSYIDNSLFEEKHGFVYVERKTAYGRLRRGLVVALDLDSYEWQPFATSLVRATEATIPSRIPPRKEIRSGAPLETPHIMLLVNDASRTLVEETGIAVKASGAQRIYSGNLMMNGGSISGWLVPESQHGALLHALEKIAAANTAHDTNAMRGATAPAGTQTDNVCLFAVGDGNHSLATAKAVWDEYKATLSEDERATSRVRYALVEIVNIYDEGLTFEPIHRIIFGGDTAELVLRVSATLGGDIVQCGSQRELEDAVKNSTASFGFVSKNSSGASYTLLKTTISTLAVSLFQPVVDEYIDEAVRAGKSVSIDYIHGSNEVCKLGMQENATGILLPPIAKERFFATISAHGPLPRKSFSMGEADEKRFYLECRKLF
ncbi:MAG: DUF1015 domain-containing protein [Treponema sp.]|nr:DUF1015 domain-containing protein [Treponema sp.]